MALYLIANGPSPTTAAQVAVTTGTAIKTLLQVKPSATVQLHIVEWGFSTDNPASTGTYRVELLETDGAATVTAHVAAGLVKFDSAAQMGGDPTTNLIQVGTTSTGYTSSGEGSITTSRMFDVQMITLASTQGAQYVKQFPLGCRPALTVGAFARIRVTASVAVNAYAYMVVEIG